MDPNILGLKGQGFLIRFLHGPLKIAVIKLSWVGLQPVLLYGLDMLARTL